MVIKECRYSEAELIEIFSHEVREYRKQAVDGKSRDRIEARIEKRIKRKIEVGKFNGHLGFAWR